MKLWIALLAGLVFGLGLSISGMANPAKVLGFLDIAGVWDPTLAFVMGGALLVTLPTFRLTLRRQRPVFAASFSLPVKRAVDTRLVLGAVLFGTGWGMAGFCPGPAITALATASSQVVIFVVAMAAGMVMHDRLRRA